MELLCAPSVGIGRLMADRAAWFCLDEFEVSASLIAASVVDPDHWEIVELAQDESPMERLRLERDRSDALRLQQIVQDAATSSETRRLAEQALQALAHLKATTPLSASRGRNSNAAEIASSQPAGGAGGGSPQTDSATPIAAPADSGVAAQFQIAEGRLIGSSARIGHVAKMIQKLGNCRWPTLLIGETGAGKEVVARSIHSVGAQGPFVMIDCSALVGPVVESELFGHVKGAFTGTMGNKTGLIEMANGGTAFFDEIGELPLDLQAKLLRVLQEKEFRPVGSLVTKKSDFRILAATNRDLAKEVERGTFRRDLFFRLNVVTVRIPPLRERKEDLPLLLEYFLGKFGFGPEIAPKIAAEVLQEALAYEWPGNIRELENSVQKMVAICSGTAFDEADSNGRLLTAAEAAILEALQRNRPEVKNRAFAPTLESKPATLREVTGLAEYAHLLRAFTEAGFDLLRCAEILAITPRSLQAELRRYGIAQHSPAIPVWLTKPVFKFRKVENITTI